MERIKGLILFIVLFAGLAWDGRVKAAPSVFSKTLKASLLFELPPDDSPYLRVYLRLVNERDGDVTWMCDSIYGIEAELLDAAGKTVPQPPFGASVTSTTVDYLVPYGSRMDWLISHGGISGVGDFKKSYAIEVGGRLWMIPKASVNSYSLRVRLNGVPWLRSDVENMKLNEKLLLDLPPQKIVISRSQ